MIELLLAACEPEQCGPCRILAGIGGGNDRVSVATQMRNKSSWQRKNR